MDSLTDRINSRLAALAEGNDEYAAFNARIVNSQLPVLGVRVPDMRKLAKQLAKEMTADDVATLLKIKPPSFEYVFVCGLLITHVKMSDEQAIVLAKQWLLLADSWAHIDCFVESKPRFRAQTWSDFAVECLKSDAEFTVRYGVISLMSNFLDDQHIDETFKQLRAVKHDGYYVKMALAWTYATAAVTYFDRTLAELEKPGIDPWTRAKAYQKMRESRRFNDEQQAIIKVKRSKS